MKMINIAPRFDTKEDVAEVEAAATALEIASGRHSAARDSLLELVRERMDEAEEYNRSDPSIDPDTYWKVSRRILTDGRNLVDSLVGPLAFVLATASEHRAASERFLAAMSKAR